MKCTHCGGTSFDEDRARADLICLDCGMVMSENVISSEVEFVETGTGQNAAVGRFVSDESHKLGYRESRQITENRARRRIDTICGQLRLGNDVALSGFRYYQSALFRGMTRGRNASLIAASCIYLAARQLRINLMLLDLSDAVGINVYVLGRVYCDLKKRLNIAIPEMDPCMYIDRFASQLEFGEKTSVVATTAMRILQRMKKDWIATGRRPSGLAAAALLVAARIHEFNRTEEDVARIARISQLTAKKRLQEFGRTPTSALSIDAFFSVDYDEEHDPPAFSVSKKTDEPFENMNLEVLSRVCTEVQELERRIQKQIQKQSDKFRSKSFNSILPKLDVGESKGIEHLLPTSDDASCSNLEASPTNSTPSLAEEPTPDSNQQSSSVFEKEVPCINVLRDILDGLVQPEILESCVEDLHILTKHSGEKVCELLSEAEKTMNEAESDEDAKPQNDELDEMKELPLDDACSLPGCSISNNRKAPKLPVFLPSATATSNTREDVKASEPSVLNVDDIDDDELDREYILKPREVMLKAAMWYKANAEYLENSRRRKLTKNKQLKEDSKAVKRQRSSGSRRPRIVNESSMGSRYDISESKPLSKKINYEALEAIVNSSANNSILTGQTTDMDVNHGSLKPGPLLAATLATDLCSPTANVNHELNTDENPRIPAKRQRESETGQDLPDSSTLNAEEQLNDEEFEDEEDEPEVNDCFPSYAHDDDDDDDMGWQNGDELW